MKQSSIRSHLLIFFSILSFVPSHTFASCLNVFMQPSNVPDLSGNKTNELKNHLRNSSKVLTPWESIEIFLVDHKHQRELTRSLRLVDVIPIEVDFVAQAHRVLLNRSKVIDFLAAYALTTGFNMYLTNAPQEGLGSVILFSTISIAPALLAATINPSSLNVSLMGDEIRNKAKQSERDFPETFATMMKPYNNPATSYKYTFILFYETPEQAEKLANDVNSLFKPNSESNQDSD